MKDARVFSAESHKLDPFSDHCGSGFSKSLEMEKGCDVIYWLWVVQIKDTSGRPLVSHGSYEAVKTNDM